jgi:hypothetical protein
LDQPLVLTPVRFAALHCLNPRSCDALLCKLTLSHSPALSCLNRARCVIMLLQFAACNTSTLSSLYAQHCYLWRVMDFIVLVFKFGITVCVRSFNVLIHTRVLALHGRTCK